MIASTTPSIPIPFPGAANRRSTTPLGPGARHSGRPAQHAASERPLAGRVRALRAGCLTPTQRLTPPAGGGVLNSTAASIQPCGPMLTGGGVQARTWSDGTAGLNAGEWPALPHLLAATRACVAVSDQPIGPACVPGSDAREPGRLVADVSAGDPTRQQRMDVKGGAPCRRATRGTPPRHQDQRHCTYGRDRAMRLVVARTAAASDQPIGRDAGRCPERDMSGVDDGPAQSPLSCADRLVAGVCRHGGAPLCDSASHETGGAETFSRLEGDMGLRGPRSYLTEVVMDEAEEADEAVIRLLSVVARSTTDGVVDRDELLAIRVAGERAGAEVRDVVRAAEKAATADHVADNVKRGGVTAYVRRRADAVGLHVPEFGEPRDAA